MKSQNYLVAFAAGYFLSYLYRSINAVISPELTRDLALAPGSLGLLTSAYFIAFAIVQLPAGILLDRYGPRRVEPVLLAVAGAGALLFALADSVAGLVVARAFIGAGAAVCLMAPLKAIATWCPRERQASRAAWVMTAGGTGALVATTPTELALRYVDWRALFVGVALLTFGVAVWIWIRVPDTPKPKQAHRLRAQWEGLRGVYANARFWWIAPLGGAVMGTFFGLQGLWSVPWLIEVVGYDRAVAARHLLVMGVATLAGFTGLGLFATRLAQRDVHPRHIFALGFALNVVALAAILAQLPGTYLWWGLYGLGASTNILGFAVLGDGFAKDLAGRVNTALNLLVFSCGFAAQWGIGLVVDAARTALGLGTAGGLKLALGFALLLNVVAYAWFMWGWRRHAAVVHETAGA